MGILTRKKVTAVPRPQVSYENEYRQELCTQAQLAEELVSRHLKNGKITLDRLRLDTGKVRHVLLLGDEEDLPLLLLAKYNFEAICSLHTDARATDDFLTAKPPLDKGTLVITMTENADALSRIREERAKLVPLTSLATDKSRALATGHQSSCAFPIASFTLKYILLTLTALYIGRKNQVLTELYYKLALDGLHELRPAINNIMKNEAYLCRMAAELSPQHLLFTGRNVDYAAALYVSRLFSYAYDRDIGCATLSALDGIRDKSNVVAIASNENLYQRLPDLPYSYKIAPLACDDSIRNLCYQGMLPLFNPLLSCITAQVIAYHIIYGNEE